MANLVLCLNAISTWYLVGLIWMVQVVHYPLFAKVATDNYVEYQVLHQKWITWIVGPPMLIEAFTTVYLLYKLPEGISITWAWVGVALLAMIWLSTAFLQVPCHNALSQEFNPSAHRRLVSTNWIRTIAWTLRGILVAWFVFGKQFSAGQA